MTFKNCYGITKSKEYWITTFKDFIKVIVYSIMTS